MRAWSNCCCNAAATPPGATRMGVVRPRMLGRLATGIWQSASARWWIWIRRFAEPHEYAGVTEAEARAAFRAFVGVGNVEPWIARQAWEAAPTGWTVPGELQGFLQKVGAAAAEKGRAVGR